jgi:glutamate/tyrosine decarboxylase-like PLP-dependent enzyme
LWAAASPTRRRFVVGVDQADSWATDGHKWLNVSYDCGIALVRDPARLRAAARSDAPYLVTDDSVREPMHLSPQSSQRARGIEVWAVLAALGRQGLAELVDRTCDHAQRFATGLGDAGFSVLNDVELNQVVVDFGPATDKIVAAIQAEGTCWAGPTTWRGRRAMRLSVSCWATMSSDVERSLDAIVSIAQAHTSREERQP